MTSTQTSPTRISSTVDRLLDAIAAGAGATVAPLYAPDADLDATVPGWRFVVRGREAVAKQYAGWFADPGQFEELERFPTPTGEVITYLLTWVENGMPHAGRHCHVLDIDPTRGLISTDRFFCGGRWSAAELAEMAEAQAAADAAALRHAD